MLTFSEPVLGAHAEFCILFVQAHRGTLPPAAADMDADEMDDSVAASEDEVTSSNARVLNDRMMEAIPHACDLCQQVSVAAAAAASAGDAESAEYCLTIVAAELTRMAGKASLQAAALPRKAPAGAAAAPDTEASLKQKSVSVAASESSVPEVQLSQTALESAPQPTVVHSCEVTAAPAAAEAEEAGIAHGDMAVPGPSPSTSHLQNTSAAVPEADRSADASAQHSSAPARAPADSTQSSGGSRLHAAPADMANSAQSSSDPPVTAPQAAALLNATEGSVLAAAPVIAPQAAAARDTTKDAALSAASASASQAAAAAPADRGHIIISGPVTAPQATAAPNGTEAASPVAAPVAASQAAAPAPDRRECTIPTSTGSVMTNGHVIMECERAPAAAPASENGRSETGLVGGVPEALGESTTTAAAPIQVSPSTPAPAEPGQTCTAASLEQQASVPFSEPASAAAASQGREGDAAPAQKQTSPLRPHEQKVAAALLVVLSKELKYGRADMVHIEQVLMTNSPDTAAFIDLMPAKGRLPSLKQLEASLAQKGVSPYLRLALSRLSEQCAAAGCQPLEVFTRSMQCTTHLGAAVSLHSPQVTAKLRRLRESVLAVALEGEGDSSHSGFEAKLTESAGVLALHGLPSTMRTLIPGVVHEVARLLIADGREPPPKGECSAGESTSFIFCLDHMLPGKSAIEARCSVIV